MWRQVTDLTQKTHCRHNCLCLGLAWIPLMYGSEETGGHWTGGYTSIRVPQRSPVHLPAVLFSCFYVWQIGEGDTAYTDNRELLSTVKPMISTSLQRKSLLFLCSPMKIKMSESRPPRRSPPPSCLSNSGPSASRLKNAGKTLGKHPPFFLRLPSPRTNNRRISVFTGIMTQSALRLAASSDRKFYLAMG